MGGSDGWGGKEKGEGGGSSGWGGREKGEGGGQMDGGQNTCMYHVHV